MSGDIFVWEYVFTCSDCGKKYSTLSLRQFENNVKGHLSTHNRTEPKPAEVRKSKRGRKGFMAL